MAKRYLVLLLAGSALVGAGFLVRRAAGRSQRPPAAKKDTLVPGNLRPRELDRFIRPGKAETAAPDGTMRMEMERERRKLSVAIRSGTLSGWDILERFRAETDPPRLEILVGTLLSHPPVGQDEAIVRTMLDLARADENEARRRAAIFFLGNAWDRSGEVGAFLLEAAEAPGEGVRSSAFAALRDYQIRNPLFGPAIRAGLLRIARGQARSDIRAAAIGGIAPFGEEAGLADGLADFLRDGDEEVRRAAEEILRSVRK